MADMKDEVAYLKEQETLMSTVGSTSLIKLNRDAS